MKKWFNFFTVLIVAIVTLTLYFSYNIIKHPYIGAMTIESDQVVQVKEIEPLTWADENLNIGDEILSIDENIPSSHSPVSEWNMLEQVETLKVKDINGEVKTFHIDLELDAQIIFHLLIPLIILGLCGYCSYLIYRSYKKSVNTRQSAILLIVFLFTFSIAYMGAGSSARGDSISRYIIMTLLIATPVAYLHFMHRYYKELNTEWFSKRWVYVGYSLALLNLIISTTKSLSGVTGIVTKNLTLLSFLITFSITAIFVTIGLKKVKYKSQKYLIKVLFLSNGFAFLPFFGLYVVPYVVFKVEIFSPVFLTGFLLIIPFTLVYQFLATKIYDIEFIVGRIKYYSLIIAIPSILGVILLVLIENGNPIVFVARTYLILFLIMFVTLYLKEFLDYKFNLSRFSEKMNYQDKLTLYTKRIRVAKSIYEVYDILKATIIDTLIVTKVNLIELSKSELDLLKDKCNNESLLGRYSEQIENAVAEIGHIEEINNGFVLNSGEADGKIFILLATSDINTPILTRDEKQWLNNLSYYTNVTLENFMKIEHLMENLEELENNPIWLNKIVFSLEEKQRSDLAKDLHDSVLQDLISIKRDAEILRTNYKQMTSEEIDENSLNMINNLNDTISTTRRTCNELRPQLLYDLGLEKALNKLIGEHIDGSYNITLTTRNLDQSINEDVQLNIYRITQELLNNAKKHSLAKQIIIIAVKIKEKVVLHYEDDGVGEQLDLVLNKEGSMGLSGIRERVRILNGTMDIKTEPGKGFKTVIEI